MKKMLLLLLFVSGIINAQDTEFKLKKEGLTDFVVILLEGKTEAELYKKTLDWIEKTYKGGSEVIKGKVENEYIRFEGIKENAFTSKYMGIITYYNMKYTIEMGFKNGKYKMDVISLEMKVNIPNNPNAWADVFSLPLYDKDGTPKKRFETTIVEIPNVINEICNNVKDYISSSKKEDKW